MKKYFKDWSQSKSNISGLAAHVALHHGSARFAYVPVMWLDEREETVQETESSWSKCHKNCH